MARYSELLILHSYFRWVVVLLLIGQLIWFLHHRYKHSIFTRKHFLVFAWSLVVYDIQFVLGWILFFQSTLAQRFWASPATMVKVRDVRFFGLEHMTMMTLAMVLLHIMVIYSSRLVGNPRGFRKLSRWFIVLIVIVLASIPWSFSPFTHRPDFR